MMSGVVLEVVVNGRSQVRRAGPVTMNRHSCQSVTPPVYPVFGNENTCSSVWPPHSATLDVFGHINLTRGTAT